MRQPFQCYVEYVHLLKATHLFSSTTGRVAPMSALYESTYKEQVKWIRKKISGHEVITMSEYATTFGYFEEEVAEIDFLTLVSKSFIPRRKRTGINNRYETWKHNEGVAFWASRVMEVSETGTAGGLVANSLEGLPDKEVLFTSLSTSASLHSPNASTTASRSSNKKHKASYITEEPWHGLNNTLTRIVNCEKISDFPSPPPSMDPIHALLFEHAVLLLKEYIRQDEQDKDIVLVKDAQVAMSCVLNLMSARACEHFFQTDMKYLLGDAVSLCAIANFDSHTCSTILRKYLEVLKENGIVYLKRLVTIDRGALSMKYLQDEDLPVDAMVEVKTLRILELLCDFIIRPHFLNQTPTETDCMLVWTSLLRVIADKISFDTGKNVLKTSKILGHMRSAEYSDVTDTARKFHCLLLMKDIELSNINFNSPETSERGLAVQHRNNLRLARCIQEYHISLGEKDVGVLMADVFGFVGIFYLVKQMGTISVAGRTTSALVHIPQNVVELQEFLNDNSLAMIWNYMTYLERQGSRMVIAKERFDSARRKSKLAKVTNSQQCDSPTTRSYEHNVTPTSS